MTSPERLARLDELLDRQDIHAALTRISRGIDRFDQQEFLSGFHDDAVIDSGVAVGPASKSFEMARILHEHGQSATQHLILNHSCDLDGDTAHTETHWLYVGVNRDDTNWLAGGRYVDRLERRNGDWRIAFRSTVFEWSTTVPANSVPLFDVVTDQHLNGVPSRTTADPSYIRPFVNRRELRAPADPRELSAPKVVDMAD